jgi:hypothetical protein
MKRLIFFVAAALLVAGAITFSPFGAKAQFAQPHRYEREQKNSDDNFQIISLKQNGLALFRERDKYKQNNKIWELIFLDTALVEKKIIELEIKERYRMIGYEVTDRNIYFLFRTGDTNRNDLYLIDIDIKDASKTEYTIKPDIDFKLTHFITAGSNFIFGGYVNSEAVIVLFDPATNGLKVVPGFFQKDTELVDMRTNVNKTFNIVLFDRSNRFEKKLIFKTFDHTGKELLNDMVNVDPSISLQSGLSSALEREELVIAGTWGDKSSKQSSGFFVLPINPFAEQKIQYYGFGELNHAVDYLPEKRAGKIKESARELVREGKRPSFTSYVTPFRIQEDKDGFYLLAEVFAPSSSAPQTTNPFYYNNYYMPYGSYNPYWSGFYYPGFSRMYRPYMYNPSQRNVDEVKTLATIVLSFDENGKVKWDQSLKLDEIRLPAMTQVGDFARIGNEIVILYKQESDIKMKRIPLDSDSPTETTQKVKTLAELDVIRSEKESESGVRHWYGNSFYVWGYQTIRNTSSDVRVRDVFYINRIDP